MLTRDGTKFDRLQKSVRLLALAGLLASYVAGLLPISAMAAPVAQSATTINGKVFRDFNSDGQINSSGANSDIGVANVTVTIYNGTGAVVAGPLQTDNSGNYSVLPSTDGPYRVEFTNLPAGYVVGRSGTQNGTSVQFVNSALQASNVNLAILRPGDAPYTNPRVVTASFPRGPLSSSGSRGSVVGYDYNVALLDGNSNVALAQDTGALWGLAYSRGTQKLYGSAFVRNGSPIGSGGYGGIYVMDTTGAALPTLFTVIPNAGSGTLGSGDISQNIMSDEPGKMGLGDIDMSEDESTLYVTNLNDRRLYSVPVANPGAMTSVAIPNPGCVGGNYRPWGLKPYQGKVYVGVVCDAEFSANAADLMGYVYAMDPTTGVYSVATSNVLTYTRGYNGVQKWAPWVASTTSTGFGSPFIGDIEFDDTGAMIIGMGDRYPYQFTPAGYSAMNKGDLQRACKNASGTWDWQQNGICGGVDGVGANLSNDFYDQGWDGENETGAGGLALLPGSGEVIYSVGSSQTGSHNGYTWWFNVANGAQKRGHVVYYSNGNTDFAKTAALGDVEILADPAPIEIGNRVWLDLNRNGIQDAGEAGISGVQVLLSRPDGTSLGSATTDGNGNYYFRRESSTGAYSMTLRANTPYVITINPNQSTLSAYMTTAANAGAISGSPTSNDAILDTRDSDATLVNGLATINYTTGGAGSSNHGLDFGFSPPAPTATPTNTPAPATATPTPNPLGAIGNQVWNDLNGNGIQDSGEPYVQGVKVELLSGCSGTTILGTRTTDTSGYYNFPGRTAGQYRVRFTLPTGYQFTAKNQGTRTTHDSNANTDGVTDCITLAAGQLDGTIDAGLVAITATPTPTPVPATATPTPAPAADLSITKSANVSSVISGVPFNYILTVVNRGPGNATNVVVTDQLPAGVAINSVVPTAGGSCSNTAGLIRCTWASLANGANATVTINVTP